MNQLLVIAAGGALGAMGRFLMSKAVHNVLGTGFPYGTLTVNVLGSLCMGLVYVMLVERLSLAPEWRAFVAVGLLGAFTTFSTFSLETVQLLAAGEAGKALLNVLLSVVLCIAAAWGGLWLGRQL